MQKLLIICGPTATGKTALSLKLAHLFSGEIISADSRQVYKGMSVGTGKDIPSDFKQKKLKVTGLTKKIPVYISNKTKIWGYDLVRPDQEFSVSQFVRLISSVIHDIKNRHK